MSLFYSLWNALLNVAGLAIELYIWVVIIGAVLSWLKAFGIINSYNEFVAAVDGFCARLTEPALRRIRRFLPAINGIDLSPIALILGLTFLKIFLSNLLRY
ncbi:MAG: YggT family protein [Proteobacteria bacterium]|jgi:YggT family protein|nr:YggT family protein [Alphaproteobacteria bacterium]NCC02692.1 YggT family protein [Pseudomonadota bacterium]